MHKLRLFPILLIFGYLSGAFAKEFTLCDLVHSGQEGKDISVRGKMSFTRHGMVFLPEPCKESQPGVAILFPKSVTTPKVDFDLDRSALQTLSPFFRPSGGTATACGVLQGRLLFKQGFHLRNINGGPQGNGYGSSGALRWGLVLRSVLEIQACD